MRRFICGLSFLLLSGCSPAPEYGTAGFSASDFDVNIRPQDDLYSYVNGRWQADTEIPPQWPQYGALLMVVERTQTQVRELIDGAASDSSPESKSISAMYQSFMNEKQLSLLGLKPLDAELARIDALASPEDVLKYMGYALTIGVPTPVNFFVESDGQNPDRNLAYFWQDGLGLPDREYYLGDNPKYQSVRERYRGHIQRMFELAHWDDAQAAATVITELETRLATSQWSQVQNRDSETIYSNRFSLEQAQELTPGFEWRSYLNAGGFDPDKLIVIAQVSYFQSLANVLATTPVEHWRTWLKFKLLKAYAPYLTDDIVVENFAFQGTVLRGLQEIKPRWQRGVELVNGTLGEAVGKLYVARYFPEAYRARIQAMVANLRSVFGQAIDQLSWMSDTTKAQARIKLAAFNSKIGYPDKWRDYSGLSLHADTLIENVAASHRFDHEKALRELREPVDRTQWGMTPQTVNAYYSATLNEIVFPAAILQPPFFDAAADDAYNYGAIGAIIGHEFSHGFDDQGRKFDAEGKLRDWWTAEDAERFAALAQKLVVQYNAFKPLPDLAINGELTLGENIADLVGLRMAWAAWQLSLNGKQAPVIDNFSGAERFFTGFSKSWRSKYRPEFMREVLLSDPHAPGEYRVLGATRNLDAFQSTFKTRAGDGMYLAPEDQVRIW